MTLDLRLELLLPELIVAGTALGTILAELLLPPERRRATALAAGLGILAALAWLLFARAEGTAIALWAGEGTERVLLTGWRADGFGLFLRALLLGGGLLAVMLSVAYARRMDRGHGEFYGLLLFALLGALLLTGVSDLLSLFVCLELLTVTSYVLAALKRNDLGSTEAGLKYLVVGALSSAVLLLGIALVYGAVGDVSFARLTAALGDSAGARLPLLAGGLVLVVVGILFKVGAVPFHVWIPDVYEGAPSPVVAFLITGSKAAGVILLLRLGEAAFLPHLAGGLGGLWVWLLGAVAIATLLFGILGAIPQRSFKRMIAYSSIGHAAYLLMGVAALAAAGGGSAPGHAPAATAILFYLLAYFVTNLTAFTVVVLVSGASGSRHGDSVYAGLSLRSPFLALAMCLALLSLAGVPPLAGFFGKFLVLRALVDKGLYFLAFLGALGVIVSLYFYFLWIRCMYMRDPDPEESPPPLRAGAWARAVLVLGIAGMLGMGVVMGPFHDWALRAAEALGAGAL